MGDWRNSIGEVRFKRRVSTRETLERKLGKLKKQGGAGAGYYRKGDPEGRGGGRS